MQQSTQAHGGEHGSHEPHVAGVTHDAILRPVGILFVVIGCLWGLFISMGIRAGSLGVAEGAGALVLAGAVMIALGKPQQKI